MMRFKSRQNQPSSKLSEEKANKQVRGSPQKTANTAANTSPQKEAVMTMLKQVKFKRRVFGGVDEEDVWKKIEKLNSLYAEALKVERIRYSVLAQRQEHRQNKQRQGQEKAGDA